MAELFADVQETVAIAPAPAEPFTALSRDQQREVFFVLPETVRERLVADLDREELQRFISRLDPDEATDVLGYADETVRESVLADLDSGRRERIDYLLSFNPESAAGIMDLDYVTVRVDRTVSEVGDRVRRFEEHGGRLPTIFVTTATDVLGFFVFLGLAQFVLL